MAIIPFTTRALRTATVCKAPDRCRVRLHYPRALASPTRQAKTRQAATAAVTAAAAWQTQAHNTHPAGSVASVQQRTESPHLPDVSCGAASEVRGYAHVIFSEDVNLDTPAVIPSSSSIQARGGALA